MMVVAYNSIESSAYLSNGFCWLLKQPGLWEILDLPDVSWLEMLVAAAGLVVVIWGILRFVAYMNEDVDPAEADQEMLKALNELRRQGDLTDDEFRSIKGQITGRLKTTWSHDQRAETTAKTVEQGISGLLNAPDSSIMSSEGTDSEDGGTKALKLNQSETFTSPTNVPEPSQDHGELSKGSAPLKTEDVGGNTEAGQISGSNDVSQ